MYTSYLSSLALCYAVLATATPGHVLEKRLHVIAGDKPGVTPDVEIEGVKYPAGSFAPITDPPYAPGLWVEGPNNPICDMSCLNPGGSNAQSCQKAGCAKGINRNAVYVNKDQITGFWGNDLAICAKASSIIVDATPV
ncbi:hypothetical protein MMC22_005639 [Lobaria immixta]|nr:hypothetical protein [Lobaria immixta]